MCGFSILLSKIHYFCFVFFFSKFKGECADPVIDIPTSDFIVHENYDPNSNYNDIALIRLARNVTFTDWVRPICLPFPQNVRNLNFDNSSLVVAGFGRTEHGMNGFFEDRQTHLI